MADGSKIILACIATATLMITGSTAADADRPLPGNYEITTATTYHDVPLPDTTLTTTSCLSAEDLARDPDRWKEEYEVETRNRRRVERIRRSRDFGAAGPRPADRCPARSRRQGKGIKFSDFNK